MRKLGRHLPVLAVLATLLAIVPLNMRERHDGALSVLHATEANLDPSPYGAAAAAIRRDDYVAAERSIEALISAEDDRRDEARIVLGLYASISGHPEEAARLLSEPGDVFEDFRLLAFGQSLAETGREALAVEALSKLFDEEIASPLRHHAVTEAVAIARQHHRLEALRLIEQARSIQMSDDDRLELEMTAWEIGDELGLERVQRAVAKQLLTHFPLKASELEVIELFRGVDGKLDWPRILTPAELVERAENLLDVKLPDAALQALDVLAASDRDLEWSLLKARTLIRNRLGDAALAVLQSTTPEGETERARVDLHRAEAALEVATARQGKPPLESEIRRDMRSAARTYLWRVVRHGDADLVSKALRLLHVELIGDDLFEEAMAVLRRLREIDPEDTTGAEHLWESGWKHYTARNYSSAIGYWSQLRELYEKHRRSRSALYWSARAQEQLGHTGRAGELYRQVAATPTTDFYGRYARLRLGGSPPVVAEPAPESWPDDAALRRAESLHQLGLDEFALLELDAVAEIAEPRALNGMRATVLAAQGRRRDSIHAVWRAFPTLGRPQQDSVPERAKRLYYPLAYDDLIRTHAVGRELPIDLVFAMIRQESAFDAGAHSWAGARGLMQVMPATGRELARRLGVPYSAERLNDPSTSVLLGTAYFRQVLDMFDGNVELALAGYNGGPYRIKRLWRDAPPGTEIDAFIEGLQIAETRNYVKRILLFSDSYQRLYPGTS